MDGKCAYSNDKSTIASSLRLSLGATCVGCFECFVLSPLETFYSVYALCSSISTLLGHFAFMVQEPPLYPCTPQHTLNGYRRVGSWKSESIPRS